MKKSFAAALGMSLLGAGMYASNASANIMSCSKISSTWEETQQLDCRFDGVGWENAFAQTQSGFYNGARAMLADLVNTFGIAPGFKVGASAIGINGSGQTISGCYTGQDFSTAQGSSVGDATGCQNGVKHMILIQKGFI